MLHSMLHMVCGLSTCYRGVKVLMCAAPAPSGMCRVCGGMGRCFVGWVEDGGCVGGRW